MAGGPITTRQWEAARALIEGAAPVQHRVAEVLGIRTSTLSKRAAQDGWETLDFRSNAVEEAYAHLIDVSRRHKAGLVLQRIDYGRTSRDGLLHFIDEVDREAELGDLVAGRDGAAVVASLRALPELSDLPPAERAARLRSMLTARIEAVLSRAEAGGSVDPKQVAAIGALAQLAEKIAPAAAGDSEAARRESAIERDRRLAAALERVNGRILYLSKAFAVDVLVDGGMARAEAEAKVAALP